MDNIFRLLIPLLDSLVYLVLGLLAVMGFYGWRFTVYVHEVGGYWNALTGHRASAVDAAATAANAAASVAAKNAKVSFSLRLSLNHPSSSFREIPTPIRTLEPNPHSTTIPSLPQPFTNPSPFEPC